MSESLADVGVDVLHHQAVGDNLLRIVEAIRLALTRVDVVIVTGGLGPTQDDITRDASVPSGLALESQTELEELLREKFRCSAGVRCPSRTWCRPTYPKGRGSSSPSAARRRASLRRGGSTLYAVPGVPAEMVEMLEGAIIPELAQRLGPSGIVSRVLRWSAIARGWASCSTTCSPESANPTVAYLASAGEVKVRLTAKAGRQRGGRS